MIKDVLVCLEGSASSDAATSVAMHIGVELGARLTGLAVVDEPDIRGGAAGGIGASSYKHERDETLIADAKKHTADWTALFERRCRQASVVGASLEVVGRPAEIILAQMATHELTVVGRDANFRFETEPEDGATRDHIVRRGPRPVLLVPEGIEALGQQVVVAFDGSHAARRAAASFAESGLGKSRTIHVATVGDDGARAREMAEEGAAIFRQAGLTAQAHNVVSPLSNADAIFELGGELDVGVFVMGAFAHSRLAHLFRQSAMRTLVQKSAVPLFLQS